MRKLYFIIYYKNIRNKKYFQFYEKFKSIIINSEMKIVMLLILFLAKVFKMLIITIISIIFFIQFRKKAY